MTLSAPIRLQIRQSWTKSFQTLMEKLLASCKIITATLTEHGPTWILCQVMDEDISGVLPTWPAFNSLISEKPAISICQGLPLYPFPPTDWSTLYTALKIIQGINVEVSGNQKTIVSFDLKLYSKAMQVRG